MASHPQLGTRKASMTDIAGMELETDIRVNLESSDTLQQNKEAESLNNSEDEGICVSHNLSLTGVSEAQSQPKAICTSEVNEENQHLSGDDDNVGKRMIVMSDDDSDDDYVNKSLSVGRRRPAILSDDEDFSQPKIPVSKLPVSSDDDDESEDNIKNTKKRIVHRSYSESDDDTAMFLTKNPSQHSLEVPKLNFKYNNDLYDAELSDEERPPGSYEGCQSSGKPHDSDDSDEERANIGKKKKVKHQPPTLKQQQVEVREIYSESQRMVRDSQISLPYHKPKQRTLTEFLNRRKKVSVPQTHLRTSFKMSMRNIETLRLLEEKKKEVEEFYKSDSDQEDPDDQDWKPGSETKDEKESPIEEMGLEVNLEEEKTADKLTVFTGGDELPDITQVIDSLSSTVKDDKSSVEEKQNLEGKVPLAASECESRKEDQCVEFTDKNNESGIHSGVSSPSDHSQSGDAAVACINTASEVNACLLNDINHSDEDISICEKEKNDVVSEGLDKYSEGKALPLVTEHLLPVSAASVTKDIKKTNTPKLSLLASKLRDVDLSNIIKSTPKISFGGEDDFIDLEEEASTPKMMAGVNELMDRFVKHSSTKRKVAQKQQVNLSIVSKEKDADGAEQLVSSNVVVTLDAEQEQPTETVPGARLVSLKTALKAKIREQREKVRIRRVKEKQFLETEQVIEDHDGDLPDEEAELTDQSDTEYETESEPEENDIVVKDKKHKKSAFVDDEAEDEEDEDMDEADETENGGDDNDVGPEVADGDSNDTVELPSTRKKNSENDDDIEEDDSEQLKLHWEESQDVHTVNHCNSWQAPSISRSNTEDLFASQMCKKIESVDKDASTTSMDSSFEFFGSVIPGHQPGGGMRHTTAGHRSESEGDTTFLTPFTKTKSNSFSSTSRERDLSLPIEDSQDSCNVTAASRSISLSPSELSLHLTPLKDSQFPHEESQKVNSIVKLRLDFTDIGDSQKDELIDLCSGQFAAKTPSTQMKNLCEDNLTPTQDIGELMGLCSGQFASHGEKKSNQAAKSHSALSELVAYDSSPSEGHHSDEEELLNLCTAKFTTQATRENSINDASNVEKPNSQLKERMEDEEMRPEPQMIIYSSDEEGAINRQVKVKASKKRKRIMQFSDDEDAQDAIEYDDEENEIPRTSFSGFKDKMKGGIRADFLENEAELSGSDVNTDDEEDDDQDDMEEEEGDLEQYDENELRDQVGRAHLKTVLDSDKREIRLLQEMYLEDGELHGEGRQRQFRWKNIGDDTEDNEKKVLSDEEGGEDEIEDAEWRKQKIEREKFLKEQRTKVEDNEPVIFKLNRCPIVRSTSMVAELLARREPLKEVNPAPIPVPPPSKSSASNHLIFQSKRGSFLSRDKNTLARIAELTKDKGSVVGGAKQAGNFVFQQLSAKEKQEKEESTKLKSTSNAPISKKPRPDRCFFSMDVSSQSSSIFKHF
ncbi:claspin isoform X2 [Procambarus clarkii]|uniref:claspin isoform X2 n=2 Tax=Procambarus clarkii TaxID=6728 RepID=UPI003743479B